MTKRSRYIMRRTMEVCVGSGASLIVVGSVRAFGDGLDIGWAILGCGIVGTIGGAIMSAILREEGQS